MCFFFLCEFFCYLVHVFLTEGKRGIYWSPLPILSLQHPCEVAYTDWYMVQWRSNSSHYATLYMQRLFDTEKKDDEALPFAVSNRSVKVAGLFAVNLNVLL